MTKTPNLPDGVLRSAEPPTELEIRTAKEELWKNDYALNVVVQNGQPQNLKEVAAAEGMAEGEPSRLDEVKAASKLLRESGLPGLDYHGFVEGDDLGKGTVDVVVTEGFTGNIALKTAEGTARQIRQYLRNAMGSTLRAKLAYVIGKPAFDRLRTAMDPRESNGGVFLGLDGVVIKSHGGMDAVGTAGAIELGHAMVRRQLLGKIREMLAVALDRAAPPDSAPGTAVHSASGTRPG